MRTGKTAPMTKEQARKLVLLGVILPHETTIAEANHFLRELTAAEDRRKAAKEPNQPAPAKEGGDKKQ